MDLTNMKLLVCLSLVHLARCIMLTTQPTPTTPIEMKTEPDNIMQEAQPAVTVIKPSVDDAFKLRRTLLEQFGHGHHTDSKISRSYQPPEQPYQFYMPVVQNVNEVQTNKIEPNSKYTYYVPTRQDSDLKDEHEQSANGQSGYQVHEGKSQLLPMAPGLNHQLYAKTAASQNPAQLTQGGAPHFGGLNPMLTANPAAHLGLQPFTGYGNGLMPNLGAAQGFYGAMPQMYPVIILNIGTGYQNPGPQFPTLGGSQFKYPQMLQPQYNYQSFFNSLMQNQINSQIPSHPQVTQAIFRSDNLHLNQPPFVPSPPYNPEHIKKQDTVLPTSPPQAPQAVMDPRHIVGDNYQHNFDKYANFNEKVSSV